MNRIALIMLFNARGKYAALVFGLSFAVLMGTQETAIFLGVLHRSTGPLQNVGNADVWVTARHTKFVGWHGRMEEQALQRVRGVPGVAWAVPFLREMCLVEFPDGQFCHSKLIGLDRSTLIGQPPEMIEGSLDALRQPDAVLVESSSRKHLHGVRVGDVLRINDRRVRVVGICRARTGLLSMPLLYTTYDNARRFFPHRGRYRLFLLVKVKAGTDVGQVCRDIEALPNLQAFTAAQFRRQAMEFVVRETSIGLNFALAISLGVVAGLVISTAAFNQFTTDSLPHFALLKAVGGRPRVLVRMVLLQAGVAGLISYGIGIGLAGLLSFPGMIPDAAMTSHFPWQLMLGGLLPVLLCLSVGSLLSLRRVLKVDPVVLFQ